jgi:hypothetical protein
MLTGLISLWYEWDYINIYIQICKDHVINWMTTGPQSPSKNLLQVIRGSSTKMHNELKNDSIKL